MPPRPLKPVARRVLDSYGKPVFSHKPLATPSWASSNSFANMKHPSLMSSEELGGACVAAAREQIENPAFWKMVADRGSAIHDDLEPRDIALILNGFSRTRQLGNHYKLIEDLAASIEKRLPYFSSLHLAMTLSALGKSGLTPGAYPGTLVDSLVREIKSRVHELGTSVEYCMILNALVKLNITDMGIYERLCCVFQSKLRMGSLQCHVRDLCVISNAFSVAGIRDSSFFDSVAQRVIPTLAEATPAEVAKLLSALARGGVEVTEVATAAKHACGNKFKSMTSSEITNTVYAFGQLREVANSNPAVDDLISLTIATFIYSIPLFQIKEVSAVLTSLARWRIVPSDADLVAITQKLSLMSRRFADLYTSAGQNICAMVPALAALSATSSADARQAVVSYTSTVSDVLVKSFSDLDWSTTVRVIAASNQLGLTDQRMIAAVSSKYLVQGNDLDASTRNALTEALVHSLSPDHDLVLAIQDS